jgi:carbon starvation protein CstA
MTALVIVVVVVLLLAWRTLPALIGGYRGKGEPLSTIQGRSDEAAAEEMEKQESLRRLDHAYGCYAYIGLFIMGGVAIVTLASKENREGYAMGLGGLPCLLLPIALVAAIVLSVRLRRHRTLAILGLSTLFLVAITVAGVVSNCCQSGASEYASYAVFVLYGAVATLVPAWWFARGRRHFRGNTLPGQW